MGGWSQDGGVGRHRVHISPQLGSLPDAGEKTSMPKETGGMLKWTGRTWGDWRRRRSGGQTGPAPLRGGWERGGVHTPRGTLGGSDQGETHLAFPLPNQPGKSALRPGPTPSEAHPGLRWSWRYRKKAGKNRRGRWEGPSRMGGEGEEWREITPPTWAPRKPSGLQEGVPHPLRQETGEKPGPLLFRWA